MTHRDNVLATIEHRNTGRIPFSVSVHNSLAVHGSGLLNLLREYPGDFYDPDTLKIPDIADLDGRKKYTDKWGCEWESVNSLINGAVIRHPLSDWNDFRSYGMPKVQTVDQRKIDAAEKMRERYPVWAGIDQFFQIMQNLRGSENIMMDFYTQPEEIQKLIDRMLNEYHLPALEEQLKLKPDIVGLGDDWGTQTALMISPDLWRQFFKPAYRRMIDLCHQGGAKAWFHSCGHTLAILPDWIELGLDVINPQMFCMDAAEYGATARGKITLMPDLNRQHILVHGTPAEVRAHILELYGHLGSPRGGLIGYAPLEPEMPLENMRAILETISHYEGVFHGRPPLRRGAGAETRSV